jgi:intracellular septation protein A
MIVVRFSVCYSVRAKSLDVAGLLALVAHALIAGLRWAVTRQVAHLAAVVALLALGAVTWTICQLA